MELYVWVEGNAQVEELEDLVEWLSHETELRGRIKLAPAVPAAGELGGLPEILVATLGGGGAVSVLATSLSTYLSQSRRRAIRIKVKGRQGQEIEVDAQRADDAERLLRIALGEEQRDSSL
ncbi:effector-associated constant component EACC1 [Streptomyces rhizosphaericola]|uniref:effector-associated constant component EACC1 n=1 Tax=Streptomyces rhizosphaericola TaxID=2564098 RepID=UPI0039EF76F2